jgi:D-beta-D-heptose 7-phosphate kinase/D-beta-D-heptose 1-phosphate adenosyltransferase
MRKIEIKPSRLVGFIERFFGQRVLVLGDFMVDRYIFGEATRISPEAPVPVVNVHRIEHRLGGAANTIHNIVSQGGAVNAIGIVGEDDEGKWLVNNLRRIGVDVAGIVIDKDRPTTCKTRVMVGHHQIVRFDYEITDEINESTEQRILDFIKKKIDYVDCLAISDYDKGLITTKLIKSLVKMASKKGKLIIVDPKIRHHLDYRGITILKTNIYNASIVTGISPSNIENIAEIGSFLLKNLRSKGVIVTCGKDGMIVLDDNSHVIHIPAFAKQVYDVTGAGDVVTATLTLALSAGATLKDAALLSSVAAVIKVGKVGTASVTSKEIKELLDSMNNPLTIYDVW